MSEIAHITVSGDLQGDFVVTEELPGGKFVIRRGASWKGNARRGRRAGRNRDGDRRDRARAEAVSCHLTVRGSRFEAMYRLGMSSTRRTGNWTPDGKVERAIARREYSELSAGQRVEQAIVLSRELTKLAVRGAARRSAQT